MSRLQPPLLALVACIGWPSIALADAGTDDPGRVHFAAGREHYVAGRYGDAVREFEAAYLGSQRPQLLYNIALCHEALGQRDLAIAEYHRYLEAVPGGPETTEVRGRVQQLEAARTPVPPAPRRRRWVWGLVGGAVLVAAGTALAVGLTVGIRDRYPTATLGRLP